MDIDSIIQIALSPIISAVTALLVQWSTGRTNAKIKADLILEKRIETLYAPFYIRCLREQITNNNDTLFDLKNELKLFEFLSENVVYMSNKTQHAYKELYSCFLKCYFNKSEIPEPLIAKYHSELTTFSRSMQSDYTKLCKLLKLEPPLQLF